MTSTHAVVSSGRFTIELRKRASTVEDELRRLVRRLDGARDFSWVLWRIPAGYTSFDEVPSKASGEQYIQVAGNAERTTVEIRRLVDGVPRQEVLGHPGAVDDPAVADELIAWAGVRTPVRPREVFTAAEAAELLVDYYQTDTVPQDYTRRLLHLGPPTPSKH